MQDNRADYVAAYHQAVAMGLDKVIEIQLQQRDPVHGITALGHAVAWGYQDVIKELLKCCK